jgi:hypothetical protein
MNQSRTGCAGFTRLSIWCPAGRFYTTRHRLRSIARPETSNYLIRQTRSPCSRLRQWGPAHMADEIMWMRCLDKRDHVILDEAEVLGAGCLKAMCDTRIYPLGVSDPRRCCRACLKAVHAVSNSHSQRIPEQRTRLRFLSEVPESLTVTSSAFFSSLRGRPSESGIPAEPIPQRAGRGSTLSSTIQNNRRGPPPGSRLLTRRYVGHAKVSD